jgi:alcohol dehydrogenase (cytochrome c)
MLFCCLFLTRIVQAQKPEAGRDGFENRCAKCHGGDGNGGELGPNIVLRTPFLDDKELSALIRTGIPGAGMPAFTVSDAEMTDLVGYVRTLRPRRGAAGPVRVKVGTVDGKTLEGVALNQSSHDMQLLSGGRVYLLRNEAKGYRQVSSQADWPTYNGQLGGNRYTKLDQITEKNVAHLAPKWVYTVPSPSRLEVTPVVVGGLMYVTNANECFALDAGSGRQIWQYQRPRTKGLVGIAAGGINRGVAVADDRVFMVTDNARLIALNRFTGAPLWDIEMADWHQNYNATAAPMAVDNLVISGTAGGEEGVRGFVAAFDQATGKEVWRFWTVPKRGEPGSETWVGDAIDHPGGVTWQIGSYDSESDVLYWPTGNPGPDFNGDQRLGDNLYTSCILALEAKTGKLKW